MSDQLNNNFPTYKPSELIAIFSAALGRQNEFAKLVNLRGIYQQRQNNPNWSYAYAGLHDESSQDEITLRIAKDLYETLTDGNLITVTGILERKIDPRGSVQITLNVTRVEKLQEQAVSLADQKKAELRRHKSQKGFRNVDGVIEQRLLADERPKVALLLANNSITLSDFEAGIQAARAAIDFTEFRSDFFKAAPLGQYLNDMVERIAGMKAKSKAMLVQQVSKQYADQIASLEKRLTKQDKDFKEERAGYVEREKRNVEEMANMKSKVAWMANKLNERKRIIAFLAVGLAVAVGAVIWIALK